MAGLLSVAMMVPALAVGPSDGDITVTGDVTPTLMFATSGDVPFGVVRPDGVKTILTNSVTAPDSPSSGACFVARIPATLTVQSNEDWAGTVAGEIQMPGHTSTGTVVNDLSWDESLPGQSSLTYQDCVDATNFSESAGPWMSDGPGAFSVDNDYALFVNWDDPPGDIDIKVTYVLQQVS